MHHYLSEPIVSAVGVATVINEERHAAQVTAREIITIRCFNFICNVFFYFCGRFIMINVCFMSTI